MGQCLMIAGGKMQKSFFLTKATSRNGMLRKKGKTNSNHNYYFEEGEEKIPIIKRLTDETVTFSGYLSLVRSQTGVAS
jgi:hypothetical protein